MDITHLINFLKDKNSSPGGKGGTDGGDGGPSGGSNYYHGGEGSGLDISTIPTINVVLR